MSLYPLKLHVQAGNWRLFSGRQSNKRFLEIRRQVLKRDNHTCQFCGFQASQYQQIVNLDQSYANNVINNLVTACVFCCQCFFLESIGYDEFGGGTIIYCPELSQAEINGMCHVLFCAITNGTAYKSSAQTIYRGLKLRSQVVEDKFGEGVSDPNVLGQVMAESHSCKPEHSQQILEPLRLLPSRAKFKKQIQAWAEAAVAESPTR